MSGISTSKPIALIRSSGGIDVEVYSSELECVLAMTNNGRLGIGVDAKQIGWGSKAHREAVERVIRHATDVLAAIDKEAAKEAAYEKSKHCTECGSSDCDGQCMGDGLMGG